MSSDSDSINSVASKDPNHETLLQYLNDYEPHRYPTGPSRAKLGLDHRAPRQWHDERSRSDSWTDYGGYRSAVYSRDGYRLDSLTDYYGEEQGSEVGRPSTREEVGRPYPPQRRRRQMGGYDGRRRQRNSGGTDGSWMHNGGYDGRWQQRRSGGTDASYMQFGGYDGYSPRRAAETYDSQYAYDSHSPWHATEPYGMQPAYYDRSPPSYEQTAWSYYEEAGGYDSRLSKQYGGTEAAYYAQPYSSGPTSPAASRHRAADSAIGSITRDSYFKETHDDAAAVNARNSQHVDDLVDMMENRWSSHLDEADTRPAVPEKPRRSITWADIDTLVPPVDAVPGGSMTEPPKSGNQRSVLSKTPPSDRPTNATTGERTSRLSRLFRRNGSGSK